jgi:hypothetical protein
MKLGGGGPVGGGVGIFVRVLIFSETIPLFATSKVISVGDRKETSGANKREGSRVHQSGCSGNWRLAEAIPKVKNKEALKHGNLQRSCSMLRTT